MIEVSFVGDSKMQSDLFHAMLAVRHQMNLVAVRVVEPERNRSAPIRDGEP